VSRYPNAGFVVASDDDDDDDDDETPVGWFRFVFNRASSASMDSSFPFVPVARAPRAPRPRPRRVVGEDAWTRTGARGTRVARAGVGIRGGK